MTDRKPIYAKPRVQRLKAAIEAYQHEGCANGCVEPLLTAYEYKDNIVITCLECGRKVRSDGAILVHGYSGEKPSIVVVSRKTSNILHRIRSMFCCGQDPTPVRVAAK
jgi:hypothetical protein